MLWPIRTVMGRHMLALPYRHACPAGPSRGCCRGATHGSGWMEAVSLLRCVAVVGVCFALLNMSSMVWMGGAVHRGMFVPRCAGQGPSFGS